MNHAVESHFTLWLMPSGDVFKHLERIIEQLSAEHATPSFDPHVTLLGGLVGGEKKLAAKLERLAVGLQPFTITLTTLDYLEEYFRCLFIRAEETAPLMGAHRIAAESFSRQPDSPFMPHLSLMYGDIRRALKEEILARIGRRFDLDFEATSIHLFSTHGEVKEWYRVREFPFSQPLP